MAERQVLRKRLERRDKTGKLDLSGLDLESIPDEAFQEATEESGNKHAAPLDMSSSGDSGWWEKYDTTTLNIRNNAIKRLPSDLSAKMPSLEQLEASGNCLRELPDSIPSPLRVISVSRNELEALPEEMFRLDNLAMVSAGNNKLGTLPKSIGECKSLAQLEVADNRISFVPPSLGRCANMVKLDLSGNPVHSLPDGIFEAMGLLKELNLSRCGLEGVPPTVGRLRSCEYIDLRRNKLVGFPEEIGACTSLVELYVDDNRVAKFPDVMSYLKESLRTVTASSNRLSELPPSFFELRLVTLDLSYNEIRSAQRIAALGRMRSLTRLSLEGNPIKTLRQELLRGNTSSLIDRLANFLSHSQCDNENDNGKGGAMNPSLHAAARGLPQKELDLSGSQLRRIPDEVEMALMNGLKRLNCSNNVIEELPSHWLKGASTLVELNLSSNRLHEWPLPSDGPHIPLAEVNLSYNKSIGSLPDKAFAIAPQLKCLNLTAIGCSSIPWSAFQGLSKLEELRLASNGLRHFPHSILHLESLRLLELADNHIPEIPEYLPDSNGHLETLDLRNNDIAGIQSLACLGRISRLEVLLLDGNPLRQLQKDINKGSAEVLRRLREQCPSYS